MQVVSETASGLTLVLALLLMSGAGRKSRLPVRGVGDRMIGREDGEWKRGSAGAADADMMSMEAARREL